ncbi:BrnT family toxin [Marinobacter halophilus]|uniref:BrnT family toxin n=2 Tax=Marinobacter halophilus TaxID=1323740 RepID=A0A2T1KDI0_9GAMM|nr:BrnT family toxin [Marinobacter halophilus]
MIGYGPIGNRVYCVVFTERGEVRRIISLRKANRREVRLYAGKI